MSKCKHTYTEDKFPTNTGSLPRPARFNLRLTCQARARTHAVFSGFRKEFGLAESTNYAGALNSFAGSEAKVSNSAMREALMKCASLISDITTGKLMMSPIDAIEEIDGIIIKAIDAPRLNCEVGTPDERLHRYHNLCREISDRHDRIGERAPLLAFPTAFEWEDRPYEESEASNG